MNQTHDVAAKSSSGSSIKDMQDSAPFLLSLRRYFFVIALLNLVWEFMHLPLYTIWNTGSTQELAFAAVHCTGGDILIAMSTLMFSLLFAGDGWPQNRSTIHRVVVMTVVAGVGYTIFSEWLNMEVRKAWAYSDLMPVVPVIDAGLSPLLQWIVVPGLAFVWALRPFRGSLGQ